MSLTASPVGDEHVEMPESIVKSFAPSEYSSGSTSDCMLTIDQATDFSVNKTKKPFIVAVSYI